MKDLIDVMAQPTLENLHSISRSIKLLITNYTSSGFCYLPALVPFLPAIIRKSARHSSSLLIGQTEGEKTTTDKIFPTICPSVSSSVSSIHDKT